MKKMIACILTFAIAFGLCGIGLGEDMASKRGALKQDAEFIVLVQKSLEDHWASLKEDPIPGSSQNTYRARMTEIFTQALETIGALDGYDFQFPALKALAQRYVAAVNTQLSAIPYYDNDTERFNQLYTVEGYNERCMVVAELVEHYGLTVDEMWKYRLADLVEDGTETRQEYDLLERVSTAFDETITFVPYSSSSYKAFLVNPTDATFQNITCEVFLYNAAGDVLGEYSAYEKKWEPGKAWELSLYLSGDDDVFAGFDHAEARLAYYDNVISQQLKTEWNEVSFVQRGEEGAANPGKALPISITLLNELPEEITVERYPSKYSFVLTDFRLELQYIHDKEATYRFYISGVKKSGADGRCHLKYRVTSMDGSIVYDSGSVSTPELKADQLFKDVSSFSISLKEGSYLLELMPDSY